jgi:uncharacterized membrane protein
MKFDAARTRGEIRRFCLMIEESTPQWVRVLFVASLGALCLVELDRRFYSMGKYTPIYIDMNYVIAASAAVFIAVRVYRAYRR